MIIHGKLRAKVVADGELDLEVIFEIGVTELLTFPDLIEASLVALAYALSNRKAQPFEYTLFAEIDGVEVQVPESITSRLHELVRTRPIE